MDVMKILDVKTQLGTNLQTLSNFRVENSDEAFRMHLKDQWGMAGQFQQYIFRETELWAIVGYCASSK